METISTSSLHWGIFASGILVGTLFWALISTSGQDKE